MRENERDKKPRARLEFVRAHLLRSIYASELERQAIFALVAVADLDVAVAARDLHRAWYSIQAFLVAAGNVSKLFWPQKREDQERGELLRQHFEMPDGSPLASRELRNHFEHFDERIDGWAEAWGRGEPSGAYFVDSNIGPIESMGGVPAEQILRNFDPATYVVSFRGDRFELRPLIAELARVRDIAENEKRPPWDRLTRNPMSPAPFPKDETE